MNYRRFGRTGWQVSDIGYGMWGMGGWTGSDDEESLASLQRAVDLGCNFFDTAWGYGAGHSEGLLGQLVRANPGKQLYTATKMPPKNFKWPSGREFTLDDCFPPDHIEQYVHSSLKNAGLESFDLMQFHTWEDSWVEDDRWAKKLDELKQPGPDPRHRHQPQPLGAVERRADRAQRADRRGAGDLQHLRPEPGGRALPGLPGARRRGDRPRAVRRGDADGQPHQGLHVARRGLAQRLLRAGEPRSQRRAGRAAEAHRRGRRADHARDGAAVHPEQPDVSTIIPGMRKVRNVEANIAASDAGPLPEELHAQLRPFRWDRQPTEWSQ